MKTSNYHWYNPPFEEYNVAQSAAVPFMDKDVNMVVSFPTATGKTVLAECAFAYHMKSGGDCRVAYVCPTRSLAAEKYEEWRRGQFSEYGVVMGTGDTVTGMSDFMGARMSVTTVESFDSKTRIGRWKPWLESLSCVVFDEAHLIGSKGRGGALECSIVRFSALNPSARIILLSATMSNGLAVARWVKSLNSKETKCITSSWSPTKVEMLVERVDGYDEKVERVVEMAKSLPGKKTIVFVHSRVTGGKILKALRASKIRSAFHNASLSTAKRRKIEEVFGDAGSGLDIIVSTSTLGMGVNI